MSSIVPSRSTAALVGLLVFSACATPPASVPDKEQRDLMERGLLRTQPTSDARTDSSERIERALASIEALMSGTTLEDRDVLHCLRFLRQAVGKPKVSSHRKKAKKLAST